MGFEQVAAVEPDVEAEANPFQKPNRFREWLKKSGAALKNSRTLLKKPSREFTVRAAVGAVALFVGWGVGAKPWKPSPTGRPVAAAKFNTKANSAKAAAAKTSGAKAGSAKATAGRAAAAEPVRRIAAVNHPAKPAQAQTRAATKLAPVKVTSKAPVAKATTKTTSKSIKAKPKTVAKATSKAPAKAAVKTKAKAKVATQANAKQG
jgi:hypothetical protein